MTSNLRSLGPEGLRRFLEQDDAHDDAALDVLCAQKDARHSLLYWFTDFDLALAEAKKTGRPILSLQLLGRLDDELSCVNSRFFRTTLYPHPAVSKELRANFVLHWHSVRPVPVVRVDFGNGRTLTRTITGNSAHLVLDSRGRPVDVIPGLHAPHAFLEALRFARTLAKHVEALPDASAALAHARRRTALLERWGKAVRLPSERDPSNLERATTDWKKLAGPVEVGSSPQLRALSSLERVVAEDTARNNQTKSCFAARWASRADRGERSTPARDSGGLEVGGNSGELRSVADRQGDCVMVVDGCRQADVAIPRGLARADRAVPNAVVVLVDEILKAHRSAGRQVELEVHHPGRGDSLRLTTARDFAAVRVRPPHHEQAACHRPEALELCLNWSCASAAGGGERCKGQHEGSMDVHGVPDPSRATG